MRSDAIKQNTSVRGSTGDGQRPEVGWKQANQNNLIDSHVGNSTVGFEKQAMGDVIMWNSGPDKKSIMQSSGVGDGIFGRRSTGLSKNLKIVTGGSVGRKRRLSNGG